MKETWWTQLGGTDAGGSGVGKIPTTTKNMKHCRLMVIIGQSPFLLCCDLMLGYAAAPHVIHITYILLFPCFTSCAAVEVENSGDKKSMFTVKVMRSRVL